MKVKNLTVLLLIFSAFSTANAQELKIGTYNIRQKNSADSLKGDGWNRRLPVICSQILYNDFDIFGAQEVFKVQLDDMLAGLPGYDYVGEGRDGGELGEYSPVFYKRDRFKLLNSGTFWLSGTDVTKSNLGWDAACTRVCSWVELKDKQSGKIIRFFNTHFDHVGVVARRESAKLILQKIDELAGKGKAAVILTGDFNVDQFNESYTLIANSPMFKDCYESAEIRHAQNGSFNGYHTDLYTDKRIDHIFVGKAARVERYAILTEFYWAPADVKSDKNLIDSPQSVKCMPRTPSDHYAVAAQVSFK